jgi:hypothetical protein
VHIKKHLSFAALRKALSEIFEQIEDRRQAGKIDYRLHDCLMSALAMMFFQDPSLLSFLRRLEDPLQCGNLKALFAVEARSPKTAVCGKAWMRLTPRRSTRPLGSCYSGCSAATSFAPFAF